MNPLVKFSFGIATLTPLAFSVCALAFNATANQGGSVSPGIALPICWLVYVLPDDAVRTRHA